MSFLNTLGLGMLKAFNEIIRAPFKDISVWWVLAPVFILWIILEVYFAKHKNENLGWNTALGNGISLAWITVTLMKFLFEDKMENFTWPKFALVFTIMCYGFFIAYISFKHKFDKKTTFLLASPSPIYFLSSIAILWSYGVLIINSYVFLDLLIMYPIIVGFFALIRKYTPEATEDFSDSSSEDDFSELSI